MNSIMSKSMEKVLTENLEKLHKLKSVLCYRKSAAERRTTQLGQSGKKLMQNDEFVLQLQGMAHDLETTINDVMLSMKSYFNYTTGACHVEVKAYKSACKELLASKETLADMTASKRRLLAALDKVKVDTRKIIRRNDLLCLNRMFGIFELLEKKVDDGLSTCRADLAHSHKEMSAILMLFGITPAKIEQKCLPADLPTPSDGGLKWVKECRGTPRGRILLNNER